MNKLFCCVLLTPFLLSWLQGLCCSYNDRTWKEPSNTRVRSLFFTVGCSIICLFLELLSYHTLCCEITKLINNGKYVQNYYNTLKPFSHLFESDFSEIKSMCFYIWVYFKAKYLFLSTHWLWEVDGLLHISSLHDLKSARLLY